MTYPHVPAAFINALKEEGLFGDAIEFLQKQWNETCALRAELREMRAPLGACTQDELDAFAGLDPRSQKLFFMWADRALQAEDAVQALRLELEKIAWMDEFLDAAGANAMMQIARDAVNADERSVRAPPKGDADDSYERGWKDVAPPTSTTEREALEVSAFDAPLEYDANEASAWARGYNAALSRSTGSGYAPASTTEREAVAWRWRVKGDQNWNLSSRMPAELNDYCEIEPLYAASTTERKALDREEKLLLEEYHSGRLNGNRVIKAAFERLRAALSRSTGSGDGK